MPEINQEKPSNSQKFFPTIIIIGIAAFGFLFYSFSQQIDFKKDLSNFSGAVKEIRQINPFQLPASNDDITESYEFIAKESDQTPFSLLMNNAEVEYDQYDFGVFIKAIDQQESNSDYYWALYVNEAYAQTAADQI